jgi:hypothetical protein
MGHMLDGVNTPNEKRSVLEKMHKELTRVLHLLRKGLETMTLREQAA